MNVHRRKHAALTALFRTLLHQLMTAQIRVHDLDLPELEAAIAKGNMSDEPKSQLLLYQAPDGRTRLEVRLQGETVWLTQAQMAELFQRERSVITKHIRNIFEEGELAEDSVCAEFCTTAADGKNYQTVHYNLDVIISVGYRVKSHRGTQFRIWATQRLREYIVKGFTLDDERLKRAGGGNYFEELLARIRDIRSSEKVFWRKVLEIYATSIDYDPGRRGVAAVLRHGAEQNALGGARADGGGDRP